MLHWSNTWELSLAWWEKQQAQEEEEEEERRKEKGVGGGGKVWVLIWGTARLTS